MSENNENFKLEIPNDADFCLQDNIGFVGLLSHYGDDSTVVNSARVSFGKKINSIEEKDKKLIKFLLEHEHTSPLEHNGMTFLVKCPLFVARQWHRHRVGVSINEISARYTEVQDEFYIPREFRKQSTNNRQASIEGDFSKQEQEENLKIFTESVNNSFNIYKKLLDAGVAREQARGVLPMTAYTQYYWTCNLRSLLHFVKLRDHKDAQYEIRQYAQSLLKQAKRIFPVTINIWENLNQAN